jgi:hypothetical protein
VTQSNSQGNPYFSPTVLEDYNRITEVDDSIEDNSRTKRSPTLPAQNHETLIAPQRQTKTAQNNPPAIPAALAASLGPKESVPIKLILESFIERFNVAGFLYNTDITIKFGQLLNRLP